jgi:hypothetical protein
LLPAAIVVVPTKVVLLLIWIVDPAFGPDMMWTE